MKKTLTIMALFATTLAISQTQIPNSDFESVFTATGVNPDGYSIQYDSLTSGWTSGNPVKRNIALDNDSTEVQFMSDTNYTWNASSQHAIVMHSFKIGPILATGNVGTGSFVFNTTNPFKSARFGVPFADRPISMIGYYQYKSVNSDTCRIEILLSKWNTTTMMRDTVARGVLFDNTTTTSFNQFSIPLIYTSTDTTIMPDSCSIYCLSSAFGIPADMSSAPRGQIGSTLIVDDFKLIYNTSGIEAYEKENNAKIYTTSNFIYINFDTKPSEASVQIVDLSGKLIYKASLENQSSQIAIENKGIVFVNVVSSKGTKRQKILLQ